MSSAYFWPLGVYGAVLLLHLVVSAQWVTVYVRGADGQPLRYRLNGLRVFAIAVAL